jgi:hypothetical protein
VALLGALPRLVLIVVDNHSLTGRIPEKSYASIGDIWNLLTNTSQNPYDLPKAYDTFGVNLYDGSLVTGTYFWILVVAVSVVSLRFGVDRRFVALSSLGAGIFTFLGWNGVWPRLVRIASFLSVVLYPWEFLAVALVFVIVLLCYCVNHLVRRFPIPANVLLTAACVPALVTFYFRTHYFVHVALGGSP